jgi:N6-adenosine-specific RNA methylase IME4
LLRKIRLNPTGEEKEITTQTSFPGPYLEIFGREKEGEPSRPGWTVIGYEANATRGEDIAVSLQNLIAK